MEANILVAGLKENTTNYKLHENKINFSLSPSVYSPAITCSLG